MGAESRVANAKRLSELSAPAKARLLAVHASRARVLFIAVSPLFAGLVWLLRASPYAAYVTGCAWLALGGLLVRGHRQLRAALQPIE